MPVQIPVGARRFWEKIPPLARFLLLPVIWFLIFGFTGYSETDGGFIPALSWRILNGQKIYLDFIYVRPPLSPLLHAMTQGLLPLTWETWGERLIFYLMLAFSSWWGVQVFPEQIWKKLNTPPAFVAGMAFLLSVHNFPAMPWHTTDGIFFASLGLFLLSRDRFLHGMMGILALLLAAMTKQSFYPMPLVGMVVLLGTRPLKNGLLQILAGVATFALLLLAFVFFMGKGMLSEALTQTSGATSFSDLIEVGVLKYLKPGLAFSIPMIALGILAKKFEKFQKPALLLFGLLVLGLFGLTPIMQFIRNSYQPPQMGYPQAIWLLSLAAVWNLRDDRKNALFLLAGLGLAWCSGISWGYAWPILFFAPLLLGLILFAHQQFNFKLKGAAGWLSGAIILTFTVLLNFYSYQHEGPSQKMNPEKFPPLGGIRVSSQTQARLFELNQIREERGDQFTIFPAMPAAHYLTRTQTTFPLDWAHNAEAGWPKRKDKLVQALENGPEFVLIEKERMNEAALEGRYGSGLTAYVIKKWTLSDSTAYFYIYEPSQR